MENLPADVVRAVAALVGRADVACLRECASFARDAVGAKKWVRADVGTRAKRWRWALARGARPGAADMYLAAFAGDVRTMRLLVANGAVASPYTLGGAARGGSIAALKWHRTKGIFPCAHTTAACAAYGNVEALVHLRETGCAWDARVMAAFARRGDTSAMALARLAGAPMDETVFAAAARGACHGPRGALLWCYHNRCPFDETACVAAAEEGEVEVLVWLRKNGCPWNATVSLAAAGGGFTSLLHWALSNGCPCLTHDVAHAAVAMNREHTMAYLYAALPEIVTLPHLVTVAVDGGHFAMAEWLLQRGAEWTSTTSFSLAVTERADAIEWALRRGHCDPASIFNAASLIGSVRSLDRARELADLREEDRIRVAINAACRGHVPVLQWLLAAEQFMLPQIHQYACQARTFHVSSWAHLAGEPMPPVVVELAAAVNRCDVLVWAAAHFVVFDPVRCMLAAREHGAREAERFFTASKGYRASATELPGAFELAGAGSSPASS